MAVKKRVIHSTQASSGQDINLTKSIINKHTLKDDILKHIMSGLSYMVSVLVLYSLVRALEQLIPTIMLGVNSQREFINRLSSVDDKFYVESITGVSVLLKQLRIILFQMTIPLFSAFTANSIAGKSGLILGFLGGCIASNPIITISISNNQLLKSQTTSSGFIGAMIISIIIGYIVKYLNDKININNKFLAIKSNLVIPIVGLVLCIFITLFIINPLVSISVLYFKEILLSNKINNEYIYSVLIAIGTTFDFGGPINKTTGLVASGFLIDGVFPVTARTLSVVIPSIGMGLSTIIDKYLVKRKVYNESFCNVGKTSLILGFMGISEGCLPFALENPKFVIPINIIGSIIGTLIAITLGAVQEFPESAIWAWFFSKNVFAYIFGILIGVLFIAIINVLYRNNQISKGKLIL